MNQKTHTGIIIIKSRNIFIHIFNNFNNTSLYTRVYAKHLHYLMCTRIMYIPSSVVNDSTGLEPATFGSSAFDNVLATRYPLSDIFRPLWPRERENGGRTTEKNNFLFLRLMHLPICMLFFYQGTLGREDFCSFVWFYCSVLNIIIHFFNSFLWKAASFPPRYLEGV
jgi:hypothetical protein